MTTSLLLRFSDREVGLPTPPDTLSPRIVEAVRRAGGSVVAERSYSYEPVNFRIGYPAPGRRPWTLQFDGRAEACIPSHRRDGVEFVLRVDALSLTRKMVALAVVTVLAMLSGLPVGGSALVGVATGAGVYWIARRHGPRALETRLVATLKQVSSGTDALPSTHPRVPPH